MKKRKIVKLTGISLVALTFSATAATNVWDGVDGANYTDGANWIGGIAPANDLLTDVAQFTGGAVNLDADRSVNGLDITTASTLNGTGTTLTVGAGNLSGTGALTINTDVTLAGTGASHSGGILIDGATVAAKLGSSFGSSVVTLDNGGTITGISGNHNMSGLAGIILGSGGGTLRNSASDPMYNLNAISGAGMLTLDGGGNTDYPSNERIQLTKAYTYTGGTLIQNKANAVLQHANGLGSTNATVTIDDARLVTATSNMTLDYEIDVGAGGATISGDGRASNWTKGFTGTGDLVIDGQNRDNDDSSPNGELRLLAASTLSGNVTLSDHVTIRATTDSLGTGTLTIQEDALLRNHNNNTTIANDIVIGTGGARLQGAFSTALTLTGDLTGTEALTISGGSGSVLLNGDGSGFTGLITLEDGADLGGTGSIGGDLTIGLDGTLVFSTTDTLTVGGVVSIDSLFGVDDLIGLDSTVADGTYTLIAGDTSASFIAGFENIGLANAYDLGDSKSAYFTEGSLQVTVIPEPATLGLVAAFGAGILFIRRRLQM